MKILNVVGARPNFMKIAPLMREYAKNENDAYFDPLLVHTGQHYSDNMSKVFIDELGINSPDLFLSMNPLMNSQAEQVADIMVKFEKVCVIEKPDAVLVVGDVNSTVACALAAKKLNIKVIHLEAGLRSFDMTMPEEINRIITDSISDVLLTSCQDGNVNLAREGKDVSKIHYVGNIMIDSLYYNLKKIENSNIRERLNLFDPFILVTLHRPSNVDDKIILSNIMQRLRGVSEYLKVVFPMHPRTKHAIIDNNIDIGNIIITEPLGYYDFNNLMMASKGVITDSGGVQEETTAVRIPCLTIRKNTERPVTIREGTNELYDGNLDNIYSFCDRVMHKSWKIGGTVINWDGNTAKRVIDILKRL